jgi:hypothetical protein
MSSYRDIIELVDSYRPNAFDERLKLWWLVTLDGKIATEIMLMDVNEVREIMDKEYPEAMDFEPLVGFPHEELYLHYLEAKICYANEEYNSYQNAMESFNAFYRSYCTWFLNTYDPIKGLPGRRTK